MPGLGLGEERLHPDSPLAHRLLVGRSRVMAAHRLQVVGVEGPMDDAAMLTLRAFRLEWTGVAGGGRGTVDNLLLAILGRFRFEGTVLRTAVLVALCVVSEGSLGEELRAPGSQVG